MITHSKEFGVYHWDTFDNETILIHETNTLKEAQDFVNNSYKGRISSNGADRVDIVNKEGTIVAKFSVC